MVQQLQRWRHRLARDVVIQPEVNVAHARAAAVTDRPLYRSEPAARACSDGYALSYGLFNGVL